jgi:hypothetical protein
MFIEVSAASSVFPGVFVPPLWVKYLYKEALYAIDTKRNCIKVVYYGNCKATLICAKP